MIKQIYYFYLISRDSKYTCIQFIILFNQAHQDQSRSYKEVCAPVIERCHFLFNELRPAFGNEVNDMSRSKLLQSTSRWKMAINMVIEENRKKRTCKFLKNDILKWVTFVALLIKVSFTSAISV